MIDIIFIKSIRIIAVTWQLGLSSCKLSGLLWEYALGTTISKNANKEILKYLLIGERTIKGD